MRHLAGTCAELVLVADVDPLRRVVRRPPPREPEQVVVCEVGWKFVTFAGGASFVPFEPHPEIQRAAANAASGSAFRIRPGARGGRITARIGGNAERDCGQVRSHGALLRAGGGPV